MGKGNRSRIERAMNESAYASKHVQAKKNKVSGAGIFVAVAAILVVIALLIGAIGVLNDGGWFARSNTVVETGDFKVDGAMMNYFFMTQFNSYYQYYYQMWLYYFQSSYESPYDLMGIDANKSLKDQYVDPKADEKVTWFDHYMGLTEDYVAQMLTYCVFATNEGMSLTDEDYAEIDHSIEELKASYESEKNMYEEYGYSYPYKNFSAFLSANYGSGVKEKDVRNCLELITLAAKYEEKLTDEKKAGILADTTNAAVEEYVKNNPANFLMADYYSYSFTVSSKDMTDADFEAKKAELLEKAKKLAESTSKDEYKAAVIAMLLEAEKETYRDKNWATYLKENENDEAKAEKAMQEYFEKTYTEAYMDLKYKATLTEGYKYPSTHTDLSKWVFGYDAGEHTDDCTHEGEHDKSNEAAKPGDLTYFETTEEKKATVTTTTTTGATTSAEETTTEAAAKSAETTEETTEGTTAETTEGTTAASGSDKKEEKYQVYTVTVYMLEKDAYRNTEMAKNFGYVIFSEKNKAQAEKFYEEFKKGTMNKDTMVDLLEELHEEISVYDYAALEDYLIDDLKSKYTGADEWLKTAKAGDCSGVVELTYTTTKTNSAGKAEDTPTTYYGVMVYDGDSYEYWYTQALVGATSDAIADWYEANGLDLNFNSSAYKYINI